MWMISNDQAFDLDLVARVTVRKATGGYSSKEYGHWDNFYWVNLLTKEGDDLAVYAVPTKYEGKEITIDLARLVSNIIDAKNETTRRKNSLDAVLLFDAITTVCQLDKSW